MAHFLRATHGLGAALSLLSRRAPELRHIRRWTQGLFAEPAVGRSTQLLAGWFATSGAGSLFVPADSEEPFAYCGVAGEGQIPRCGNVRAVDSQLHITWTIAGIRARTIS